MKIKLNSSLLLVILLLASVGNAAAQTPTAVISAGSGSGKPGDANISVLVSLNSQDGAQVAGLNFDLSFDGSRLNVSNISIGSAASSAGKIMSWSKPSPGTVRVIIFGLNQDVIPNGTIANVIFNVLVGAAPGISPLTLSNAAATDPSGNGIGVILNNGSFTVLSPPTTNTPTSALTDTPITTFTPTSATTSTPMATSTSTSTITPISSATSTMTPSIGPSPTGGPSATPTPTKTDIPSASATSESKPTSSVTPTPNTTASPEGTASPTGESSPSLTPTLDRGITTDPELDVGATSTAMAGLEAAVAATATALAVIGQEPTKGDKVISWLSSWLGQWGDVLLVGGVVLGATLLVAGLYSEVWRRKAPKESRKRIY